MMLWIDAPVNSFRDSLFHHFRSFLCGPTPMRMGHPFRNGPSKQQVYVRYRAMMKRTELVDPLRPTIVSR